ncbi:MAG: hypothetical protein NDJ19_14050 [Ramlibacter sp.]|nr:hypothetical protein [Ramlibacter sp.]
MMTRSSRSLQAGASEYRDDAVGAGAHALETTRNLASQAMERAGETVRDLRYGASDLARRGATTVGDATAAAQRQLGHYAQATGRYVSEQPVKSALIAAAVGAAVAALVLALRRNRRNDYY